MPARFVGGCPSDSGHLFQRRSAPRMSKIDISRGWHVIIARYDQDSARGNACPILVEHPTRPRLLRREAVLMIALLWRCALHEVGLSKRLAVHSTGTRVASFAGTAQCAQHTTHNTALPALPYRIRCVRLVSVIDHTVCSRNGPSRQSEAQSSRTCTQSLVIPLVSYRTCIFPSAVSSAQQ